MSRDGRDIFFSTYDTLVPQDENGPFVKFYDARTGGGFVTEGELLPCEAADECHGETSQPPPNPKVGTGTEYTAPGNARNIRPKKGNARNIRQKKKRKHRHARHRKDRKHRHTARGNG